MILWGCGYGQTLWVRTVHMTEVACGYRLTVWVRTVHEEPINRGFMNSQHPQSPVMISPRPHSTTKSAQLLSPYFSNKLQYSHISLVCKLQ
ncbi:hypothetical protein BHAP_1823 [Bifidobacterium hapali]|uniref:Uncharacterized protein n=1 Tax=Bifidobacterium hapali TaxID=1630172 RepID=A0A261FWH2_9BIFI|nr:hypothetical protein BHAP_1823 [Bifidobacterium hapali]